MENPKEVLRDTMMILENHRHKASKRIDEITEEIHVLDKLMRRLKRAEISLWAERKVRAKALEQSPCCSPDFEKRVLEIIRDTLEKAL